MKKTIIGIVIGIIISGTTVYAASILSSSVVYDNSTSNGSSKTVQGALDELYGLADTKINIGDLNNLTTTNKSDLVSAINEIKNSSEGIVYSTNEVDTGKIWIDGKKIYRKCYKGSNVSISSAHVIIDSSLTSDIVSNVISIDFNFKRLDTWFQGAFSTGSIAVDCRVDSNGIEINSLGYTVTDYSIILEYTKK